MRIRANGIDVNYALEGPEDAPVVMMSHSLATDLGMWRHQLPALTPRYRVLRYDSRGHGDSSAPAGDYDMATLAGDAAALVEALDLGPVHWVGISMGGMIGQHLALEHPGAVASLTLCDTTARVPPEAADQWEERIRTALEEGLEPLVAPTLERWFSPAYCERVPAVVEEIRTMIRSTPPRGYAGCCRAIMHHDVAARLAGIRHPALVMVGEHDEGTPVAAAEVIQQGLPGAVLTVLPGARHLSNIEAQEAFDTRLRAFLDAQAG